MRRAVIKSCGAYLPENIVTNFDLEEIVDTSDEWIVQRTGIKERRFAAEDQTTSDMAIEAAKQALEKAGLTGADIDGIIVATSTPDKTFPATAVYVQAALGMNPGPAFDVQAVCSGFIYALSVADSLIQTGTAKRFLVIGAEKFSSIMDFTDRTTCVIFGDGAGAVILEAEEGASFDLNDSGIVSTHLYADGRYNEILNTTGGTASTQDSGYIYMDGQEVFKHAVRNMAGVVTEVLEHNKITSDDVDWLVPHQANIRIIEGAARKLKVSMDQVIVTVEKHGNTSAASIPLALAEGVHSGQIKKGQLVLMEALGAGLTWGAALVRM